MNSKTVSKILLFLILYLFFSFSESILAYEIFIFRPNLPKNPLFKENKVHIHGEFFGQLQSPSTFPSYNDLSGPADRWNFGFQNIIYLTENTFFLAQVVVHDDGQRRTKFDWHFTLKQLLFENLALIIGHDSNHDSDYQSLRIQSPFFINRNYVGFGLPYKTESLYIEPFIWFFSGNTNQKTHLDQSGKKLRQEYGLRIGLWLQKRVGINFQVFSQTQRVFSIGQAFMLDLIIRIKLLEYLELSLGTSLWKDMKESPLGNKNEFYKFFWGIAIPF